MQFVQARNYTKGPRTKGAIGLIVVHDMEAPERLDTAEACAAYFANQPPAYRDARGNLVGSSAHYCLDADSAVQSVHVEDIAWAAPGANHNGVHLELAGYARQTREEWLDPYGIALLRRAAELIVDLATELAIPLVWLEADEVAAGLRGITTHRACTEAFRIIGGHTDPGAGFPADVLMGFVLEVAAAKAKPIPTDEELDDVNTEVRYGFEPSWAKGFGPIIPGLVPTVEVDAREAALRGYGGVRFVIEGTDDDRFTDGNPLAGGVTAVDLTKLTTAPVRFTERQGDTVVLTTQGGGRYAFTAVRP